MTTRTILLALLCAVLTAALVPIPAKAQVWKKVKAKAKATVEKGAEERTEKAIEGAFDGIEDAVLCVVTDKVCIEKAEQEGKTVVLTDEEGEVLQDGGGAPVTDPSGPQTRAPGEGVWSNYDFVPGDRMLFADNFSEEYVGDFPRRLTYVRGTMEVVEWEGRRLLRGTGGDAFVVPIPNGLPEQYTIEFDIHDPSTGSGTSIVPVRLGDSKTYDVRAHGGHYINIGSWRGSGVWKDGSPVSTNAIEDLEEAVIPIRISFDDGYVKIYAREQRIANVPQVQFPETATGLFFTMATRTDRPIYLGNLRVAAGGRTRIYETLSTEGRMVTRGILFDTGSARLSPESTPTLTDIGRTLQQHADLRLQIEGHTDNTGSPDGNKQLSQQRAESVRSFLMDEYGVAADRLVAVGMGQTVPAAPNDTEEGRQTNRRVELVVQK